MIHFINSEHKEITLRDLLLLSPASCSSALEGQRGRSSDKRTAHTLRFIIICMGIPQEEPRILDGKIVSSL